MGMEQELGNVRTISEKYDDRLKAYQEHINKRVLVDWIRIVGLDNPKKWRPEKLLNAFARDVLKYPEEKHAPFSWPVPAGFQRGVQAYRARVDYTFWIYFLTKGRKLLIEHNKNEGKRIELNKELTLPMSDEQNLGLLIRKKLREKYSVKNLKPPPMQNHRNAFAVAC
ncbi:hypothetical protein Y032_0050g1943 [Ancylostoma ceylanicum]|nr:hypothetical protein Y032_0050g1943 [Ancylostoma ceylanicum]